MRHFVLLALAAAIAAPLCANASTKAGSIIAKAVSDPARPKDHRSLDPLRKPGETLAFSGVRPGMIVGEFYPGGGYFTRMLSDVVGPTGHVYGIENAGWKGAVKANDEMLAEGKWKNVSIDSQPFGTVNFPNRSILRGSRKTITTSRSQNMARSTHSRSTARSIGR